MFAAVTSLIDGLFLRCPVVVNEGLECFFLKFLNCVPMACFLGNSPLRVVHDLSLCSKI